MQPFVEDIVVRAVAGQRIPADELLPLFDLPTHSAEAAHVMWAAQTIARETTGNIGQIYAQIGIDALPCPANCDFCDLAAKNVRAAQDAAGDTAEVRATLRDAVVPLEDVVAYARTFDDAGVHLISLMATAGLSFERILDTVAAVRAAVHDDMPILVNIGDMTLDQAQAVKTAGAQAAYHAHRLGEGTFTSLDPATRLETMRNITEAGMKLMNAVEPVHEGIPAAELLDRMAEAASFKPYCSGVGTLTVVPGTPMEQFTPLTRKRTAFYASIFRLLVGDAIPFGVGGRNVVWADAGTNPRGRNLPTAPEILQRDVRRLRKELRGEEWNVPDRPLASWF